MIPVLYCLDRAAYCMYSIRLAGQTFNIQNTYFETPLPCSQLIKADARLRSGLSVSISPVRVMIDDLCPNGSSKLCGHDLERSQ